MSIYMQHEKKVGHLTMSYVNINCGIAYVQVEYQGAKTLGRVQQL